MLLASMAYALYGKVGFLPPYLVGIVAGIASGAAMLPYTVIKEANRPEWGGTATGPLQAVIRRLLDFILRQEKKQHDTDHEPGESLVPLVHFVGVSLATLIVVLTCS